MSAVTPSCRESFLTVDELERTDCPDHKAVVYLTNTITKETLWVFKEQFPYIRGTELSDDYLGDRVAYALSAGYIGAPSIHNICLDGKTGVLKEYIEPDLGTSPQGMTHDELYKREQLIKSPLYHDQIAKISALFYLTGHTDAHLQNIVIQKGELKPIDCKSCFKGFYEIKLEQILSGNVWTDCLYDGDSIHVDNLTKIIQKETPGALKDWILALDIEKQTSHLKIPSDILLGLKARATILKFYVINNIPLDIGARDPFASKSGKILEETIKSLKDKISAKWGPILPEPKKELSDDENQEYKEFITKNEKAIEKMFLESLEEFLAKHISDNSEGVE
jgi:hypothetical protein